MSMTQAEEQVIRNVIERLSAPNCGCHNRMGTEALVEGATAKGIECVSRLYLDSWVIPALEMMLSGERRDVAAAEHLSSWNR